MDRIDSPNSLMRPKMIAHRGLARNCPSNSIAAFRAAGEKGFWAIETDIRKTRDGQLVCIHDPCVDTAFAGSGRVCDMTLAELRKLAFLDFPEEGDRFPEMMPTLTEYLEICRQYGCHPFIETKTEDVRKVLSAAFQYFRQEDVILSSTCFQHLEIGKAYSSAVFLHHIFSDEQAMEILSRRGYCGVSYNYPNYDDAPGTLLKRTHDMGVCFCLRAADTPAAVRAMITLGADYCPTNCFPLPIQENAAVSSK